MTAHQQWWLTNNVQIPSPHLFAYRFDGTYTGLNGGPMTPVGGDGLSATLPKFGSGSWRSAPSSGMRIKTAILSDFNLGSDDWKMSFWLKPEDYSGGNNTLVAVTAIETANSNIVTAGGDGRQLRLDLQGTSGGYPVLFFTDTTGFGNTCINLNTTPLPLNTWSHVEIGQDATGVRVYANGILYAHAPGEYLYAATPFTNQGISIGAVYAGGGLPGVYGNYINGSIDDFVLTRAVPLQTGTTYTPPVVPF